MQAGQEFKVLGQNSLGEMTLATPAISKGSLFVRTMTKVYRITKGKSVGPGFRPQATGLGSVVGAPRASAMLRRNCRAVQARRIKPQGLATKTGVHLC